MLKEIEPRAVARAGLWLAMITALGAFLRLVTLTAAPPALHFDEAVYGLMAREIGPGNWPVYFSAYTGREPLYMYIMAGIFALLESSDWTLRLTSALIGIVTIPLAYLLFTRLYGQRIGLLTATLTAISYWHLSVSRAGYPNVLIPPVECLTAYYLLTGYRAGSRWRMALGGAFIGLVLWTYLAARLWPVTVALWALYTLIIEPRHTLSRWQGWVLAVLACLAVFAPLGAHFYLHPEDFLERAGQVLVFTQTPPAQIPALLGRNLLATLGGLVVQGDPRTTFNLPGRPTFMLWMAPFLFWGLARALRHWRRTELVLLPIWLLGMCLPAILTDDAMPQSQRMSGIMPAVFALVALGLDEAWRLLERCQPALKRWLPTGLVALLLIFDGAVAARDYFGVWARRSDVYIDEHGPYELVASRAVQELEAGRVPVVIAQHYKHPTSAYLLPRSLDAVWSVGDKTLPLPNRGGAEVIYLWPYNDSPLRQELRDRLFAMAQEEEPLHSPWGDEMVRVFRLAPDVLAAEAELSAHAAFGNELAVLDWSLDRTMPRTKPLRLLLHWRALAHPDAGRVLSLHIYDEQGLRWMEKTSLGYIPEQWQPGDTVYQLYELELPRGIPAGRYQARLLMSREGGLGAFPVVVAGEMTGSYVDLGWFTLTPEGGSIEAPHEASYEEMLPGVLRLIEHKAPPVSAHQGDTITTELLWQALATPEGDVDITLALLDANGRETWAQSYPLTPGYPTSQWQPQEVVQGRYALSLRDAPAGPYQLVLHVGAATRPLGEILIDAVERSFEEPPMDAAVDVLFGSEILLLGYSLPAAPYRAGDVLPLTLHWQAQVQPASDHKVFVHLVDATGAIVAQRDAAPVDWTRPTSGWLADEVVSDPQYLTLPSHLPAGEYQLLVGLYDAETLQRLSSAAGDDGRLALATVQVE